MTVTSRGQRSASPPRLWWISCVAGVAQNIMTIFLILNFFLNTCLTASVSYLYGHDTVTAISRPFSYKTYHFANVLADFDYRRLMES